MSKEYEDKFGASEKGLGEVFKEGELLPWKKFMFKVESVSFDRIILKPIGHKKPNGE